MAAAAAVDKEVLKRWPKRGDAGASVGGCKVKAPVKMQVKGER
jgi:hypothetical protein